MRLSRVLRRVVLGCLVGVLIAAPLHAQDPQERAPFITTPDEVVLRMLRLAGTRAEDLVLDLGSGDGRIPIAAAQSFGARGLGVELDKTLVARARENAERAGVAGRVRFVHDDVLRADIASADVVTLYLLPSLIAKLQPRLLGELRPGTRIVSHAFQMSGWTPDRSEHVRLVQPHPGQGDTSTLHLWIVPADLRGHWRSEPEGQWRLRIWQNYQQVELEARRDGKVVALRQPRLRGARLEWQSEAGRFEGALVEGRIEGTLNGAQGAQPLAFRRAD